MTWRCANRRKGRRRQLAAVDSCDLGSVIGGPLLPMRPVYVPPDSTRCFACRRTHRLVAGFGAAAMAALGIVHIAMLVAA